MSLRLAALTSVLFISHVCGLAIPYPIEKREQLCNGHAELCGRSYGNVSFIGAHDSFAASGNPLAFARTQEVELVTQLSVYGVRLLQAQAHMNGNDLHFCHTNCALFDGGKVADYFSKVKHFLDRHPNEVITIILANPESVSTVDVWQPIFESTGLEEMAYVPPQPSMTREDWPTLQEMLDSGKRVVVFMDKATDPDVPYILPQFDLMWEDEYDPRDPNFPCVVDRSTGDLAPEQKLNLINHNLNIEILPFGSHGFRIPDRLDSPRTNSISSIRNHADHCAPLVNDKAPNFVLLDFVNIGQGPTAVARLNGFEY